MNEDLRSTMHEALRHMKAGNLLAATASIQHRLNGTTASEPSVVAAPERDPIEGTFRSVDEASTAPEDLIAGSSRVVGEQRARFIELEYNGPTGDRRYKLFIPSAYREQALPLIVMLHGCTQNPDDFATGTRMNALAEEHACFVAYPAQPQTANMSKCWNWFKSGDQRRDQGEPAVIAGLARELVESYRLDASRVYVGGLSAGGAMAVVLGQTYPDVFAAVGVHSGLPYAAAHDLPSALTAMKRGDMSDASAAQGENIEARGAGPPTIVFHGDGDTTVHPCNGEKIAVQSAHACASGDAMNRSASGDGKSFTRSIFKDADGKIVVEHWAVHGAGHGWFGGDPRGSYTEPAGLDASREMIRFFLERSRESDCAGACES